jgi:hypothetical protein
MTKQFYKVEHILVSGNNVEDHINNTMNDDLDLASVTFTASADPHKNNEVTAHLVWAGTKDVEPAFEQEDTDPGEDVEPVFTEGTEPPAEKNAAVVDAPLGQVPQL